MKRDQIDSRHEQDLYEAILQLESLEEVESFFHDLCTPAELEGWWTDGGWRRCSSRTYLTGRLLRKPR